MLKLYTNERMLTVIRTYMSITSLTRTLTAISIESFPIWLVNLDDVNMTFGLGKVSSEQTAAITSPISEEFNHRGCCSL